MKNLANCKPSEFLRQTVKIRHAAEAWLGSTKILDIRRRMPTLKKLTSDMTEDERIATLTENKRLSEEQMRKNGLDILDEIMEKHPDETLKILALCCFIEPEEVDDHPVSEYLRNFTELLQDSAVVGFFTSLMQLAQMNISTASKD